LFPEERELRLEAAAQEEEELALAGRY
jgi:hypothetical protein